MGILNIAIASLAVLAAASGGQPGVEAVPAASNFKRGTEPPGYFDNAVFVPLPASPLPPSMALRPPKGAASGSGSDSSNLQPNILPWQRTPPNFVPCTPASAYCRTRISNAPYCTGYTISKAGMTCANVMTLFGLDNDLFTLMNQAVNCNRAIPAGTKLCISGWYGWIPDDPSFGKGQLYPVRAGKSYQYCRTAGQMALTFDDGPHLFTPELLDYLKKENIKATFFVNGMNHNCIYNSTYSAMVQRAFREGHQIASHSWSHPSIRGIYDRFLASHGAAAAKEAVVAELQRLETALERIIGRRPRYFRPPYGEGGHDKILEPIFRERGYYVAMWTFATIDANLDDQIFPGKTSYTDALINGLTRRAFYVGYYGSTNFDPGVKSHTVLMHDPLLRTVRDLAPWVVRQMRALGFKPVTFGQCQGQPNPSAWYFPPVPPAQMVYNATTWQCPEEAKPPKCLPWQDRCLSQPGAVTLPRPWK